MSDDLDSLLLGLEEFHVRLMRNRSVRSYRSSAEMLYVVKLKELERYERPGLVEHYTEWLTIYRRLFPLEELE